MNRRLGSTEIYTVAMLIWGVAAAEARAQWYARPGHPRSFHYETDVYPGDHYNWDVAQDRRGLVYAANAWGIMSFDGVSWRLLRLPEPQKSAQSLALSRGDTLFVGGDGRIGFVKPAGDGTFAFESLTDRVHEGARHFPLVRYTVAVAEGVFFGSRKQVMRWSGDNVTVWDGDAPYGILDDAQGEALVQGGSGSMYRFERGNWQPIPALEEFHQEVIAILPIGEALYLTTESGLWRVEPDGPIQIDGSATDWIRTSETTTGLALRDGTMAVGNIDGNVGVISPRGELLGVLEMETAVSAPPSTLGSLDGVDDVGVLRLFEDGDGVLWTAMTSGIMRTDLRSPVSEIGVRDGLAGEIHSVDRVGGRLLVATSRGVLELPENGGKLRAVSGPDDSWLEVDIGDRSLIRGRSGVFERKGTSIRRVFGSVRELRQASTEPPAFWLINDDGLHRITLDPATDSWAQERQVFGINGRTWRIATGPGDVLWLGFQPFGVVRLQLDPAGTRVLNEERYTDPDDFENGSHALRFFEHDGEVLFLSENGVLSYSAAVDRPRFRFADDWRPPEGERAEKQVRSMFPASAGTVVAETFEGIYLARRSAEASGASPTYLPGSRGLELLSTTSPGNIWLRRRDRAPSLIHYDLGAAPEPTDFPTIIRSVSSADSLFDLGMEGSLPFGEPIRFHHTAASHRGTEMRFRHKLEGLENDWSAWSTDSATLYDRLPSGSYVYRAQAKDGLGFPGREAAFTFVVLPPWYRSIPAMTVWLLTLAAAVVGLVRVRTRRLERRAGLLESIVESRTRELREKTGELERLYELRSRFFANISHEFRTPLTLTFGPLDDLLAERHGPVTDAMKGVILRSRRNGLRLLRLINQLLDLSRLDAGTLILYPRVIDLADFIRQISALFESMARRRGVEYVVAGIDEELRHSCDADKVENIVVNLLTNAFKFTPKGGKVALSVSRAPGGAVRIEVSDTGCGIAEKDLSRIFERFYQVDGSSTRSEDGSGIGLSMVKDLAELHGGSVTVESRLGFGSKFRVELPLVDVLEDSIPAQPVAIHEKAVSDADDGGTLVSDPQESSPVVLVVEDNADMREYIRESLHDRYAVIETEDGSLGLERAIEQVPDLVVSDVMMPRMDGYELAAALRDDVRTSHIPIVLLTALAEAKDRIRGLEHGADGYLAKPFSAEELRVQVRVLIEQRQALRAKWSGADHGIRAAPATFRSRESEFLEAVSALIQKNLGDAGYGVDRLAEGMSMSRRQLLRKLQALTDESPGELLRRVRIERAAQMIDQKAGAIQDVARAVGYQSMSYFTKAFKARMGMTPSSYAERVAKRE